MNEVIDAIHRRRSVREFEDKDIENELIKEILLAGSWAPSGLNNQPWRFVVVKDRDTKDKLAGLTRYGHIIKGAPVCIAVFMDSEASYDRTKDCMAIGACNQNMLLATHALGLGGVWLGEILKNKNEVRELLGAPETLELMAVLAIGYPTPEERSSTRKELGEIAYRERYGGRFQIKKENSRR